MSVPVRPLRLCLMKQTSTRWLILSAKEYSNLFESFDASISFEPFKSSIILFRLMQFDSFVSFKPFVSLFQCFRFQRKVQLFIGKLCLPERVILVMFRSFVKRLIVVVFGFFFISFLLFPFCAKQCIRRKQRLKGESSPFGIYILCRL